MTKNNDRYIKNHEAAKQVGLHMLGGCTLHGFDPCWSFNYPKWLDYSFSTIKIPDFMVGLLAERMGLHWEWGENTEAHPFKQLNLYIRSLNQRHERDKNEISNLLVMLDKYTEDEVKKHKDMIL